MGWEPNLNGGGRPASPAEPGRTARTLTALISSAFAVRPDILRGPGRGDRATSFARQVAMYLSHTRLGLNYTAAGKLFGRDRTTAAHACRKVEERREDATIDAVVDCVERAIDRLPGFGRSRSADQ